MMKLNKKSIILSILIVIASLPIISAYTSGPFVEMMNLWDLFVEQMFGSFWAAVLFLVVIFAIILALGGISFYTNIIFQVYFILAMAIGYGYPLFAWVIVLCSIMYLLFQIFKLIFENR